MLIDVYDSQNPTGLAYYDSSLVTNERFAKSHDIYVATNETAYSAVIMSAQTYLVKVDFNL